MNTITDLRVSLDQKQAENAVKYNQRVVNLAKEFNKKLDSFERVLFFAENLKLFQEELSFAKDLKKTLKAIGANKELLELKLRVASLKYRIKGKRGGLDPLKNVTERAEIEEQLFLLLKKWKNDYLSYVDKTITPNDWKKIAQLALYPKFVKAFINNEKQRDEIFKIVIRDNFPVKLLVQYYKTCSVDLKRSYLIPQIGFFRQFDVNHLKIEREITEEGKKKDLVFLINEKFVSVLNDSLKIEMNGGVTHTWKEIKDIWAKSSKEPAQMAIFQKKGMLLWAPQGLKHPQGKVDTTQPNWWLGQDVPEFLEISKERLEQYFGIKTDPQKPFAARVQSSCLDPRSVDDAHGGCALCLPNEGATMYRVYPLGKYAARFPQNFSDNVSFIGNTMEGVLTYPDPGLIYTHRLQGGAPHNLTMAQGANLFTRYGKEIWYFQFAGNNCSGDHQVFFEDLLGKKSEGGEAHNYFRTNITTTIHTAPGTSFLTMVEQLPAPLAFLVIHGIHTLLGSKRSLSRTITENGEEKTLTKSVYTSPFCEDQILYSPGHLILRIMDGTIQPGKVWFGLDG